LTTSRRPHPRSVRLALGAHGEWFPSQQCFVVMDRASDYRKQANHARQLAEATWQDNLEEMLHRLARDFDEIAEDIEAGATELRHPELLRQAF
jgi:hypothetical protein